MTSLENLGGRIRSRREERNLKQSEIASALQVSAQAVSKWERGENAPDISLLAHLAKLLGVTTDWLLGLYEEEQDVFTATVFISTVKGYAKKSQTLKPREVAVWANGFLYHVTEAVLRFDGVCIKRLGDGLLAFFSGPRHQERALQAAVEARKTTTENIGVALTTGEIYLGLLGHPDYASLDIIGDTVNKAFGIAEAMGDWADLVATESTISALDGKFTTGAFKDVKLRFFPEPVKLYEIT